MQHAKIYKTIFEKIHHKALSRKQHIPYVPTPIIYGQKVKLIQEDNSKQLSKKDIQYI